MLIYLLILHHGLHLWGKRVGSASLESQRSPNGNWEDVLGRRLTPATTMHYTWPWLAGLASALPAFLLSPAFSLLQAVHSLLFFCSQRK